MSTRCGARRRTARVAQGAIAAGRASTAEAEEVTILPVVRRVRSGRRTPIWLPLTVRVSLKPRATADVPLPLPSGAALARARVAAKRARAKRMMNGAWATVKGAEDGERSEKKETETAHGDQMQEWRERRTYSPEWPSRREWPTCALDAGAAQKGRA